MDLVCAGEMLIDFTPCGERTFTANPGGAPANVVIAAARNKLETGFLGVLGNDDFGKMLKNTLEEDHVKVLCPKLTEEAVTTMAFVTLYENGDRSFTFTRKPGADMLLSLDDVRRNGDILANCRLFNAGSFSLTSSTCCEAILAAMQMVRDNHHLVSFDINYRDAIWHSEEACLKEVEPLLEYVDFLKISDEELYFVGGEENIPAFMKKYGITVLIQTLGSEGAKFYYAGQSEIIAGMQVKCVDATGAGDAFWGGFLSKLLMSGVNSTDDISVELIKEALRYGNTSGGLCVQKKGGIPALPSREEIEAVVNCARN